MLKPPFKSISKRVSFLILDYNRPVETELLLQSIRNHVKFEYEIILLINGGNQDKYYNLYKKYNVNKLILSLENEGSGLGTLRLSEFCQSEYFVNIQCDNYFIRDFTEKALNDFIAYLDSGGGAIDFTGLVPNQQTFSERAFMARTDFYCSNTLQEGGGTGPGQGLNLKGTEQAFYEWIVQNNKQVGSVRPLIIGDSGKYAIIEVGGGELIRRCDSQEIFVKQTPKCSMPLWNLSESEWIDILSNRWEPWRIPEASRNWVFLFYSDKFENEENRKFLKI